MSFVLAFIVCTTLITAIIIKLYRRAILAKHEFTPLFQFAKITYRAAQPTGLAGHYRWAKAFIDSIPDAMRIISAIKEAKSILADEEKQSKE